MGIAFVSAVSPATGTTTWSHTVTGTNTLLRVGFLCNFQNLTGITYNSVSMTQVGTRQGNLYVYELVNPTAGAHNIVVTTGGGGVLIGGSVLYSGTKQTSQPDSSNGSSGTVSPETLATTVIASGCWLTGIGTANANDLSTNKTQRILTANGTTQQIIFSDSNGIVGTGSQSVIFTSTSSALSGEIVTSIAPSVGNTSNFFQFI